MMSASPSFIISGIRNLLKRNYGYDGDEIDLEMEIDPTLTFQENWNKIKKKYVELNILQEELEDGY